MRVRLPSGWALPWPRSRQDCIAPAAGFALSSSGWLPNSRRKTMNDRDQELQLDDVLLERIVDGAMTPRELRAAVELLDRDSDGWKRCALAFLEGQVLGESLRALGEPAVQEPVGRLRSLDPRPAAAARGPVNRWLRGVAAAATVAAAFAGGWMAHGTRVGMPVQESLARDEGATVAQSENGIGVADVSFPSDPVPTEYRRADLVGRDERPREAAPRAIRTVARLRIGPENAPAEVPVLAGPGITAQWLAEQPPPLSENGQVALERQGYQVAQRRRFVMAILADGRRIAVPIDQVQIQYTGNEAL